MKDLWVIEGKFMRKPWAIYELCRDEGDAHFKAHRFTQGLYPVWRFRVCRYSKKAESRTIPYVKERKP